MTKIILASASPRRRELLSSAGVSIQVLVADILEVPKNGETPQEYAARNALEKTMTVCQRHFSKGEDVIILGCDTIVVKDGAILEKPSDAAAAKKMLQSLSGTTHTVVSGYCLVSGQTQSPVEQNIVESQVTFRHITEDEMERYIATGEPFDKAGGYGAQGRGAAFIEQLVGSYTNVVGLPLCQVLESIKKHTGLKLFL